MKTPLAFNIIRRLFETAFETVDTIEAIYEALPKNVRDWYNLKRNDPIGMAVVIRRHYLTIDLNEMIENLLYNEVEDFVFGLKGRISQSVARDLGLSTGPGFGGGGRRARNQRLQKAFAEARPMIEYVASQMETFK